MACCSSKVEEPSTEIDFDLYPHPLHIFIVSNILRRPIMIVGDEDEACTGLYLPTLSKPEYCTKWPLILALCNGSFFPLVNKECLVSQKKLSEFAIPLVSSELCPVKVKFLGGTEENEAFALLQSFISTTEHTFKMSSDDDDLTLILSAKLNNRPFEVNVGPQSERFSNFSLRQRLSVPNVMPPAPSASNIPLNKSSEASPCIGKVEVHSVFFNVQRMVLIQSKNALDHMECQTKYYNFFIILLDDGHNLFISVIM